MSMVHTITIILITITFRYLNEYLYYSVFIDDRSITVMCSINLTSITIHSHTHQSSNTQMDFLVSNYCLILN